MQQVSFRAWRRTNWLAVNRTLPSCFINNLYSTVAVPCYFPEAKNLVTFFQVIEKMILTAIVHIIFLVSSNCQANLVNNAFIHSLAQSKQSWGDYTGCRYISETIRNVQVRIVEHSNTCNDYEPACHLSKNPLNSFSWRILCTTQCFHKQRRCNDPTTATQHVEIFIA